MRHKTSWLYKAFPEDAQRAVSELSMMGAALLLIAFMVSHTIGLTGKLPQCYFLKKTGLFCPACGGTRAVEALMHGSVIKSLKMHPIVLYGTVCAMLFVIGEIISRLAHYRPGIMRARAIHFLVGVSLFGLHFYLQNFF